MYQNDKEMKKTVKYNGENIKVNFETENQTRVVDRMEGIKIADAHGTKDFVINAKAYKVEWTMKYKNTHSVQLHFEGFTCGDSEKKMIEHIISKHGL
jgi:carbonic anhydrase